MNHWYNPPHSPRTVLIQSEQKGCQNHSGPSHPAHSSLNCYRLIDATELWAPERPDTDTVSSLRQYTSWTLNNKRGTHNYNTLSIHHTHLFYFYFLISNLHILDLYIHSCLYDIYIYIILCFCCFVHCLFVYLYIIILIFVSCPVAVFLLHCGTNSLYV